jgi:hypothetical protein
MHKYVQMYKEAAMYSKKSLHIFFKQRSNGFDKLTTSGLNMESSPLVLTLRPCSGLKAQPACPPKLYAKAGSKDTSGIKFNMLGLIIIFSISINIAFSEESFIVKPKNKAEPKVTLEDCMSAILDEHQLLARIELHGSAIKMRELNWVEQIFNESKNAFLKKKSAQQLQKLAQEQQKFKQECQKFEHAARQYQDFLAQFEQELSEKSRG